MCEKLNIFTLSVCLIDSRTKMTYFGERVQCSRETKFNISEIRNFQYICSAPFESIQSFKNPVLDNSDENFLTQTCTTKLDQLIVKSFNKPLYVYSICFVTKVRIAEAKGAEKLVTLVTKPTMVNHFVITRFVTFKYSKFK